MRYKLLGNSGLRVSELALGTMTFGEDWGWGASKEESKKQFDLFTESGGNFIDTAVNYTDGSSEKLVGEFTQSERDSLVIATKYTLSRNWDDPNAGGNARKNMVVSLETSLKRLKTDYIDLFWLHMWDYMTPIEEVMRGLDDLVSMGKVLYIGVSDTPAWVVSRANMLAELRGWSQFVGLQIPYSLRDRDVERSLLPMAKSLDIAVTPWGILGGGALTGKYDVKSDQPKRYGDDVQISDRTAKIAEVVVEIAEEVDRSPAQVAANWVRQQQHRALIIPILGARTKEQLEDNLAILDWELTEEQLERLDEVSRIELGFPHGFLDGNIYIFGNTFDLIDRRNG
jgi:aryl-alcohol dehydrogenase-like predicted oxidoreductase